MNSSKSIESLYTTIKNQFGKVQAKQTVKAVISNIIDDLEEEGLEVSEKNISDRLEEQANDFVKASKNHVA